MTQPVSGPWEQLQTALKLLDIEREESRRVVLARPEFADRLRWHLDQAGISSELVEVRASPFIPADTVVVMDWQAIEAGTAEAIKAMSRKPLFG